MLTINELGELSNPDDFEPLDRRQVYCSDRCKKDARNRRRRKCD